MSVADRIKAAAFATHVDAYGVTWRFRRVKSSHLASVGVGALAVLPGADPVERDAGRSSMPTEKQVKQGVEYQEGMVCAAVVSAADPSTAWLAAHAELVAAHEARMAASEEEREATTAIATEKAKALRAVEALPLDEAAFDPVRLVVHQREAEEVPGTLWVGDLPPGVLVPLFGAVMAHFTDGGRAAERLRTFR